MGEDRRASAQEGDRVKLGRRVVISSCQEARERGVDLNDINCLKVALARGGGDGVVAKDISPSLPGCHQGKFAMVLDQVFSPKECRQFISLSEQRGYEEALVNVGPGMCISAKDYR